MRRVPTRPLGPRSALLQEQRSRRHFLREDARQTGVIMAALGFCYAASAGNDFLLLHGTLLGVSLASRALLVVAAGVVLVLLRRARWPRELDRAFHFALFTAAILVSVVHLTGNSARSVAGAEIIRTGCAFPGRFSVVTRPDLPQIG